MQMQLAIFTPITNILLADWSTRIKSCSIRSGTHGYESCEAELNVPFYEAFLYYQQLGPLKLCVSWGSYRVWEGRLEDPTQFADVSSGLKLTAFGGWVAFNDALYIALWSDARFDGWQVLTPEDYGNAQKKPQMFTMDTNARLFIGTQKGATYAASGADTGDLVYKIPDQSARNIIGISFDWELNVSSGLAVIAQSWSGSNYTAVANIWVPTIPVANTLYIGSENLVISACNKITFALYNGSGTPVTETRENGASHLTIKNLRITTSNTNRINTTLSAGRAAGVNVTATVVTTAKMFVGQKLQIKAGAGPGGISETVTVLSIGSATQFNATFVNTYANGDSVTALLVYPDEIIKDCVATLNTLNATQVSSDVTQIQSQAIDLDQAIYEDEYPSETINQLITKSDDQIPPRQWVALVYNDQRLIVRPRGTGFAWYVDITSLEIVRTLTQLYNSSYAVYKDVSNKHNLRTSTNSDAPSATKFQITRRQAIAVDTTSVTQAEKVRDSVLALQLDPTPRASVEIDRVFDATGTPFPLHFIHADDTLTIRNLPPILGGTFYDKIRTLVITRTDVDLLKNTIRLELEIPMPNLNVQMAKALGSKT